MRKTIFQNEYYYHIYNRGVDKRKIFLDDHDYVRFLRSMKEFNQINPIGSLHLSLRCPTPKDLGVGHLKLVQFVAYCLNSNHYHILLKQVQENGVSEFMKRLGGGYTNYFNTKYSRSGSLFQGKYKSVEIKNDYDLMYISAYINGNPEIHGISRAKNWIYSSCRDYLRKRNGTLCRKQEVLEYYRNIKEYQETLEHVIKTSKDIKEELKYSILE